MKSAAPQRSYAGETVYVGIDVHKRTYTVVARLWQEEVKPGFLTSALRGILVVPKRLARCREWRK